MPRYAGSGRATVESCRCVDMQYLRRHRLLSPGQAFSLTWSRDGEVIASISVRTQEGGVRLIFRCRSWRTDEWEDIDQWVPLTYTPCHFGGSRPWFSCRCGRRVGKLYLAGSPIFACRRCYNLGYETQLETMGRGLLRAQRIRERLGGSASMADLFPPKPKGMHWKTYYRWQEKHDDAETRSTANVWLWLRRKGLGADPIAKAL